jgi:hypothetical protein
MHGLFSDYASQWQKAVFAVSEPQSHSFVAAVPEGTARADLELSLYKSQFAAAAVAITCFLRKLF